MCVCVFDIGMYKISDFNKYSRFLQRFQDKVYEISKSGEPLGYMIATDIAMGSDVFLMSTL